MGFWCLLRFEYVVPSCRTNNYPSFQWEVAPCSDSLTTLALDSIAPPDFWERPLPLLPLLPLLAP